MTVLTLALLWAAIALIAAGGIAWAVPGIPGVLGAGLVIYVTGWAARGLVP